MALLLQQIICVFIVGLNTLNGRQSVYGFTYEKGIEPQLKFSTEPPAYVVKRNGPLFLDCSANIVHNQKTETVTYHEEDNYYGDDIDDDILPNKQFPPNSNTHANIEEDADFAYEDEDENGDDELVGKDSARIKRKVDDSSQRVHYSWYRNDENVSVLEVSGFRILANGTLKIQNAKNATGVYRCVASILDSDIAIISKQCTVVNASFTRDFGATPNVTTVENFALVLNCPFKSSPPANISWFFNKNLIKLGDAYNNPKTRYYQLHNGSLLVTKTILDDSGKFRCIAVNNFLTKSQRNYSITVKILPQAQTIIHNDPKLFSPPLQDLTQYVKFGGTIDLFCIVESNFKEILWTFTSRFNNKNVKKLPIKSVELKIFNVNVQNHDGYYACHLPNDTQVFDVIITQPPSFADTFMSINSSISVNVPLNCSAYGNPPPTITWFRNGVPLRKNIRIHYESPILTIHQVELEDEGLYQCFAENVAGEVHKSGYLSVFYTENYVDVKIDNIKCYPMNNSCLLITFDNKGLFKLIQHHNVTEKPYKWDTGVSDDKQNLSYITLRSLSPMQPYNIFLRGYIFQHTQVPDTNQEQTNVKHMYKLAKLSGPVQCSPQGLIVYKMNFDRKIFLWWSSVVKLKPSYLVVQFRHRDATKPIAFSGFIVGTYSSIYQHISEAEVLSNTIKIEIMSNVTTESNVTITQVKIPGNVTGILIPNVSNLVVRVLGSVYADYDVLQQNLSFIEWNTFEESVFTNVSDLSSSFGLKPILIEPRKIHLEWSRQALHVSSCLNVCYELRTNVLERKCLNIEYEQRNVTFTQLTPFTEYRLYMKHCNSTTEYLGSPIIAKTKEDIPGPVTNHSVTRDNGLTLHWDYPRTPNSELSYYIIEWTKEGVKMSKNLSITKKSYTFPNSITTDKINITIRAVSASGKKGIPIYLSLSSLNALGNQSSPKVDFDPTLGIALGTLLSFLCVCICVFCFVLRDRTCKKNNRNMVQNRSLPPPLHSLTHCNNTTDVHEMQTLINKNATVGLTLPNGQDKRNKFDDQLRPKSEINELNINNLSVNAVSKLDNKNEYFDEVTVTSPLDDEKSLTIEVVAAPPSNGIKHDLLNGSNNSNKISGKTDDSNKSHNKNGTIKNLPPSTHSISTSPSIKPNGNLRITENPQYLNNSSFTLDNSQQLLNPTIGNVSSSPENDDDDDDDDTINTSDLNESNLSTKPLQSSWNYRRPIVGPNG